jgi:uncharacterized protein
MTEREPLADQPRRKRGHFTLAGALRATAALVVATSGPYGLYVAVRSYRAEASLFSGQRHPVDTAATARALGQVRELSFDVAGARIRGSYAPSRNGASVVLYHGSGGDRNSLLPEAQALHARGFGVLLFDSPGHGESAGEIHWNDGEVQALRAAVDALAAQPETDPKRVGALGFSMGGYVVAIGAAADPRLRAVVLVGTPPDARMHTRWEYRRWGWLSQWPALLAISRHGIDLDGASPIRAVPQIAPRPLLVVGGTADSAVPVYLIRALFEAAREPKQLYLVPGGEHGSYGRAPDSQYLPRVVSFFEHALL